MRPVPVSLLVMALFGGGSLHHPDSMRSALIGEIALDSHPIQFAQRGRMKVAYPQGTWQIVRCFF